jgi:hypothetical protein
MTDIRRTVRKGRGCMSTALALMCRNKVVIEIRKQFDLFSCVIRGSTKSFAIDVKWGTTVTSNKCRNLCPSASEPVQERELTPWNFIAMILAHCYGILAFRSSIFLGLLTLTTDFKCPQRKTRWMRISAVVTIRLLVSWSVIGVSGIKFICSISLGKGRPSEHEFYVFFSS